MILLEPTYIDASVTLYHGDAIEIIDEIPDNEIQSVSTSPTYWGKRKFTDDAREFGSESLEEYVKRNITLYTKILEKMRDSGSLFIVMQDSYMGSGISRAHHSHWENNKDPRYIRDGLDANKQGNTSSVTAHHDIIKNTSLCGLPYRIGLALVDSGFIWRQQIIWSKKNPMPENVENRTRQNCEYVLHFVKNNDYKFHKKYFSIIGKNGRERLRDQVWTINPKPKEGHTATFPPELIEKLMLATTDRYDTVFEPFLGSGTSYSMAIQHGRKFIGCDICEKFVKEIVSKRKSASILKKYLQ